MKSRRQRLRTIQRRYGDTRQLYDNGCGCSYCRKQMVWWTEAELLVLAQVGAVHSSGNVWLEDCDARQFRRVLKELDRFWDAKARFTRGDQ